MDVKNKRMLFPSEVSVRNGRLCHVVHLTESLASEIMQSSGGLSSKSIMPVCDSTRVAVRADRELLGAGPAEEGCRVTGAMVPVKSRVTSHLREV